MSMCVIDWAAAGSWAQALAGFAGVGAVIWAANKGAETFGSWQRQKQVERQMAVAERLLTLAYRLSRAFTQVRNPITNGWEAEAAEAKLRELFEDFADRPQEAQHRFKIAQVVLTRLSDLKEDWDAILAAMPEAEAYFGKTMKGVLDDYWTAVVHIRASALTYPEAATQERRNKCESDFWEGGAAIAGEEDAVGALISTAHQRIEERLLPVLTSHLHKD